MQANALKYLFGEHKILYKSSKKFEQSRNFDCNTLVLTKEINFNAYNEFIFSILKACGLQENYHVEAFSNHSFKEIVHSQNVKYIFLFGIKFDEIQINMAQKQIDALDLTTCIVIACPSVEIISQNTEMKNYLWQQILKPIFKK